MSLLVLLLVVIVLISVNITHHLTLLVQQAPPPLFSHHGPQSRPLFFHLLLLHALLRPVAWVAICPQITQVLQLLQHDFPRSLVRWTRIPRVTLVPPKVTKVAKARVFSRRSADHSPRSRPQHLARVRVAQCPFHLRRGSQPQVTLCLQLVHYLLPRFFVKLLLRITLALRQRQICLPFYATCLLFFQLSSSVLGRPHGLESTSFECLAAEFGLLSGLDATVAFASCGEFGEVLFAEAGYGTFVVCALVVVDVGEDGGVEFWLLFSIAVVFVIGFLLRSVGRQEPRWCYCVVNAVTDGDGRGLVV
mmetsp:Transcript_7441/g.14102  ORF Transcript_7441/g.14102 Transcript_7441/m.14102 type:complete len:305 (-) Transcript_7441:302-1216(-)